MIVIVSVTSTQKTMEIKKEFLEPGDMRKDWSLAISKNIF